MTQGIPDRDTEAAREGRAAHGQAERMIRDMARGIKPQVDSTDTECYQSAKCYADDVLMVMRKTGVFGGKNLLIEEFLTAPAVHSACCGTCDAAIIDHRCHIIYLWDFKYGHSYVSEYLNKQAIIYLSGIAHRLGLNGYDDQQWRFDFRVVQPRVHGRGGPIRSWTSALSDIRGVVNQLNRAADAQFKPDSPCHTGPHCQHCPALYQCDTALHAGMSLFEIAEYTANRELPPAELGLQLSIIRRAMDRLRSLDAAYTAYAEQLVFDGIVVPGWKRQVTYGRQDWACSPEVAAVAAASLGIDISRPGAKTPKQAIALGVPEAVVQQLSKTPTRGSKLVPVVGAEIKRIFGDNNHD